MRLICGLGNPGEPYARTLHNAGFWALDQLAESLGSESWKTAHQGLLIKGSLEGSPFLLLKPQTFMNLSGRSLVACAQFYKVEPKEMLVVSDDLDLELGQLRFRLKGGHGGHNGLRSIIELLGTQDFARLKIGIGRPAHKGQVTGHVLGNLSEDQAAKLGQAAKTAGPLIKDFILGRPVQVETKVQL